MKKFNFARQLVLPVTWFGLSMIAMLWFGIVYQVRSEYQNAEQNAQRNLQNYARVFEEHIERTVMELDKALIIARKQYLKARETLPYDEAIGLRLPDPALLSDMSFQMATIDRDGILKATTIGEHPPKPIPLQDRAHFKIHVNARPDTPYISQPVLGRRSGRWSVQLTRRIEGPEGKFDGVLVASMDPAHFGNFYSSIDIGQDDTVIFAGTDGYVRVVSGSETLKLGDKIEHGSLIADAAKGDGVYLGDLYGSGTERMFAVQHLKDQPLFVAVGTSPEAVFAAANLNRERYILVGAVVTLLIFLAIAASIRHHQTIAYMARYDDLTGLANRANFRQSLEIASAGLQKGRSVGLVLLDIDNFKAINDTYGHVFGDKLLLAISKRLRKVLRSNDLLARLGGDEFAMLFTDFKKDDVSETRAQEILDAVRRPVIIDSQRLNVTVSVGSAVATNTDDTFERLSQNADLALFEAKRQGRNCHQPFKIEMAERFAERRKLEEDLSKALELDQLEVFYQPVQSLDGNKITGFEALLRWKHPEKGMVSPVNFIPIAEESRLIIPIGEWVLDEACKAAVNFSDNKMIAVNLSPIQFSDPNLYNKVVATLERSGLPPERLELEITESVMIDGNDQTAETLSRLRALGIQIAMDDFGTGYSSLSYLCNFEFDRIKIDRSFIDGLEKHGYYDSVIRTIINLSKSLKVHTTAEGIETLQQLEILRSMGCTEAQGYLFSPPKPLDQIRHMTNPPANEHQQRPCLSEANATKAEPAEQEEPQMEQLKPAIREAG
ncbi:MAG: EAL domain-containing protein [Hyphomicrobiales bacterium]|nr:EAL domain-containing protein [Hyphomicrobiales bacterium]